MQLAAVRRSHAPKAADGMNYIFQQPLTSHQTPWLLVLEEKLLGVFFFFFFFPSFGVQISHTQLFPSL